MSPATRRPGRAERERQILDAAVAVFTERGFPAASMEAVARLVGVTKPVLYTHFGSKEGLLLACVARARARLLEVSAAAVAAADGPEDMLRRGIRAFFDFLDDEGPAWSLLYAEGSVAAEALEEIRAQQTAFVARLLGEQDPGADPRRPAAWAQVVVGACERVALWRRQEPDVGAAQATGYVMDVVWTGLRRGPGAAG